MITKRIAFDQNLHNSNIYNLFTKPNNEAEEKTFQSIKGMSFDEFNNKYKEEKTKQATIVFSIINNTNFINFNFNHLSDDDDAILILLQHFFQQSTIYTQEETTPTMETFPEVCNTGRLKAALKLVKDPQNQKR